jgi:hypothetical protein
MRTVVRMFFRRRFPIVYKKKMPIVVFLFIVPLIIGKIQQLIRNPVNELYKNKKEA